MGVVYLPSRDVAGCPRSEINVNFAMEVVLQHLAKKRAEVLQRERDGRVVLVRRDDSRCSRRHCKHKIALQLKRRPRVERKVDNGVYRGVVLRRLRIFHIQHETLPAEAQLPSLKIWYDVTVNLHLRGDDTVAHLGQLYSRITQRCVVVRRPGSEVYFFYLSYHDSSGGVMLKLHSLGLTTRIVHSTMTTSLTWFLLSRQKSLASDMG